MEHLAVAGEEMHPADAAGGGVREDPEHEGREHRRGDAGGDVAERRLPRPAAGTAARAARAARAKAAASATPPAPAASSRRS